ncbi:MAG: flagellar basal body rod protein FlgB [Candidatus Cloacimonetes bacterium]|nr:flagellar basal body rod protein FlgB [Candidatus Cloacimonadota bacterium]
MLNQLLFKKTLLTIEKSLDAYSTRQKVLSNNIANSMTPGFEAQKVEFENELQKRIGEERSVTKKTTHEDHIQHPKTKEDNLIEVVNRNNPLNDTGLNNVEIEKEMSEMAEANLRYEMSVKLAMRKYSGIKRAIKGVSQ